MSKFFKPVDIPEEKTRAVSLNPETEEQLDITTIIEKIQTEINAIKAGTSKIHPFAIQMDSGKTPVLVALNRMKANPTRSNIKVFLVLAEQDLSHRVAEHFTMLFSQKFGRI